MSSLCCRSTHWCNTGTCNVLPVVEPELSMSLEGFGEDLPLISMDLIPKNGTTSLHDVRHPRVCRPGTYCPERTGNAGGQRCLVGHICPGGLAAPIPTYPGFYAAHEGMVIPQECYPGYYSPEYGIDHCVICPVGSQCPNFATYLPTICPRGTYRSYKTRGCKPCPDGTFSFVRGVSDPMNCEPSPLGRHIEGSAVNLTGTFPCMAGYVCPPGLLTGEQRDFPVLSGLFGGSGLGPAESFGNLCPPGFICPEGSPFVDQELHFCPMGFVCVAGTGKTSVFQEDFGLLAPPEAQLEAWQALSLECLKTRAGIYKLELLEVPKSLEETWEHLSRWRQDLDYCQQVSLQSLLVAPDYGPQVSGLLRGFQLDWSVVNLPANFWVSEVLCPPWQLCQSECLYSLKGTYLRLVSQLDHQWKESQSEVNEDSLSACPFGTTTDHDRVSELRHCQKSSKADQRRVVFRVNLYDEGPILEGQANTLYLLSFDLRHMPATLKYGTRLRLVTRTNATLGSEPPEECARLLDALGQPLEADLDQLAQKVRAWGCSHVLKPRAFVPGIQQAPTFQEPESQVEAQVYQFSDPLLNATDTANAPFDVPPKIEDPQKSECHPVASDFWEFYLLVSQETQVEISIEIFDGLMSSVAPFFWKVLKIEAWKLPDIQYSVRLPATSQLEPPSNYANRVWLPNWPSAFLYWLPQSPDSLGSHLKNPVSELVLSTDTDLTFRGLPFFSNCAGFGTHLPLEFLIDPSRGRAAHRRYFPDRLCRRTIYRCLLDEDLSLPAMPRPRWFEASTLTKLFEVNKPSEVLDVLLVHRNSRPGYLPTRVGLILKYMQSEDQYDLIDFRVSLTDFVMPTPGQQEANGLPFEYHLELYHLKISDNEMRGTNAPVMPQILGLYLLGTLSMVLILWVIHFVLSGPGQPRWVNYFGTQVSAVYLGMGLACLLFLPPVCLLVLMSRGHLIPAGIVKDLGLEALDFQYQGSLFLFQNIISRARGESI